MYAAGGGCLDALEVREVRVLHGLERSDALLRVVLQKLLEEVVALGNDKKQAGKQTGDKTLI